MTASRGPTLFVVAAAVGLLAVACAPRHVSTTPQAPAADASQAGASANLPLPPLDDDVQRLRESSLKARPGIVRTSLATVESTNLDLAAALAAVALFPSPERHIDVAAAYRNANILDKAHEHLATAARMDPTSARAYDGMARIWRDWGFANVALADAHRAVYYAPWSPEAHNTLGTVLHRLEMFPAARVEYEKALELNAGAAYALSNLCAIDLLQGHPAQAAGYCEQALQLDPTLAVASSNLEQARAILRAISVEGPDGRP